MRLDALTHLSAEENIQLPAGRLRLLSLIGHDIAQWKRIETKAIALNKKVPKIKAG
jgi:hypothetical protein